MMRHAAVLAVAATLLSSCDDGKEEMNFPSRSMEPTIKAGSKVIVDTKAYDGKDPERFDLVVFTSPDYPDSRYGFRVAGLPGEELKITEDGLRIDGMLIKHPEGIQFKTSDLGKHSVASLGANQYFLLGDNTGNARDSRHFGAIKRTAIHGKIIKIEQVEDTDAE